MVHPLSIRRGKRLWAHVRSLQNRVVRWVLPAARPCQEGAQLEVGAARRRRVEHAEDGGCAASVQARADRAEEAADHPAALLQGAVGPNRSARCAVEPCACHPVPQPVALRLACPVRGRLPDHRGRAVRRLRRLHQREQGARAEHDVRNHVESEPGRSPRPAGAGGRSQLQIPSQAAPDSGLPRPTGRLGGSGSDTSARLFDAGAPGWRLSSPPLQSWARRQNTRSTAQATTLLQPKPQNRRRRYQAQRL